MKRETNDHPLMSRRTFGALAGSAAAASLLLTHPSPSAAQRLHLTVASKVASGVAANPQDRVVFTADPYTGVEILFVITESGEIYGQQLLSEGRVGAAFFAGAVQPLDANVRWVLPDAINGGVYVVRTAGDVVYHPMIIRSVGVPDSVTFGAGIPVRVGSPVGVNPEDRHALILANRLVVIRSDGATGYHRIESRTEWSAGTAMPAESYRPVASNPQDRWVVQVRADSIGVITSSGELYVHPYDRERNVILPATRANTPQPIAANPQDRFVFTDGYTSIYVVTNSGDVYQHRITHSTNP